MKKVFVALLALLSSAICFADEINMVGDPPDSHTGDGNLSYNKRMLNGTNPMQCFMISVFIGKTTTNKY